MHEYHKVNAMIILDHINISPLIKAEEFLAHAVCEAKSELEKAGAIQAFEFSYELAWKTLKRVLAYRGIEVASPRETFRAAALEKLIEDPETWFEFIQKKKKNFTEHIYKRKEADKIFH